MKNQWVVKHDKNWALKGEGNLRVTKVYSTQAEAIQAGKIAAQSQESELIIQGRDGKIRERSTYGKDPFPPKG
ncbi:DUF2188 domain-containing protein [Iodobacter sp. HSC-16F04]|uniref:DUF2188 domain-containing protein n=1 Tax=Iodobacter violaceini TaxID=3044271 RepID=A0ABX0KS18_9NEIS|nr:DUF2188 domain-containing protein [Iodobacter violacea]NHQ84837.1 DUF2188 domain-containing protein [Iodobacter violacea]